MRSTDSHFVHLSADKEAPPRDILRPKPDDPRFKEFQREQADFQGMNASQFIRSKHADRWIEKRKTSTAVVSASRKHVEFAKNLFISWDDDGSGVLEAEEIIRPLVELGLSSDSKFATKIIQALDSKQTRGGKEDLRITLQDFVRIFKSDKVSEHMTKIINEDVYQQKAQEAVINQPPSANLKHSEFRSPRLASVQDSASRVSNKSKISLSMKTQDLKKIVEIPLDRQVDQISIHQSVVEQGQKRIRTKIYKVKGGTQLVDPQINVITIQDDSPRTQSQSSGFKHFLTNAPLQASDAKKPQKSFSRGTALTCPAEKPAPSQRPTKGRNATLQDQMETIKAWWKQIDARGVWTYEQPTQAVCGFMVRKRLASDKEQAAKIVFGQLGLATRKDTINFDEFNRVFCKGIFKEALVTVNTNFAKTSKDGSGDLPLALQINEYKRRQMLGGLDPGSDSFHQGRQILNSLRELSAEAEKQVEQVTYSKFMEDPLGKKQRLRREEETRQREADTFVERIKFIEDTEQSHKGRRPVIPGAKKHAKVTLLEARQKGQDIDSKLQEMKQQGTPRRDEQQIRIPAVYLEKTREERIKD